MMDTERVQAFLLLTGLLAAAFVLGLTLGANLAR